MHNSEFFRPFPAYEDVFYDDIENHKRYFLPICSVNLKFMFPERDEWVHFISAKEMNVGSRTNEFHTSHTKLGMFSFDIIEGKYKFEADWNYFYINHRERAEKEIQLFHDFDKNVRSFLKDWRECYDWVNKQNYDNKLKEDMECLHDYKQNKKEEESNKYLIDSLYRKYSIENFEEVSKYYETATHSYEVGKAFFEKNGHIYENLFGYDDVKLENLEERTAYLREKYPNDAIKEPEFFGFIADIKFKSKEAQIRIDETLEYGGSIENMRTAICYNIWELPFDRKSFEYIGCIEESYFKQYGATILNVFHDSETNKASMLLDFD